MKVTRNSVPIRVIGLRQFLSFLLNYWPVLVLCSLAALVLLWGLGKSSLDDWDEAIYAQISKEMVQSGDWLTLHWEYKPWFEKPPLLMWSTAIFYQCFGINEFWSRAASAFSGIGLIVITYLIGKTVYDRWVGFFAAVVLLTSYQFVASARFGTTDIMLTLFTFLAIYAYLRLKSNQKWWYMIWISCALALMVKSAAGLVVPALITLALLLDRRFVAAAKSRHFWQGLLLAFVIVVPWHLVMYVQYGQAFINEYLGQHILSRSQSAMEQHTGDRYFYVWGLQYWYFPWFYLVPFVLALSIKENIKSQSRSRLLLLVFMLVFGLYTIVRTKLYWYIVPLYPALAILTASTVIQAFRSHESVAFSGLAVGTLAVALVAPLNMVLIFGCLGLLAIFFSLATKKLAYQFNEPMGFVLDGLRARRRENIRSAIAASATHLLAVVMCVFLVVVGINELRPLYQTGEEPVAKLARIAGDSTSNAQEPLIVASGLYRPTPLFYSNRPIQVAYIREDLADFTGEHQTKEIILAKEDIESFSTEYEFHVIAEAAPLVYATIKPKGVPQDQTPAGVIDAPLVTQEIRYRLSEAGEVFLVWGINGWNVVPEETRPAGTVVKDSVMYTPMFYDGDAFVARVQVPAGTTIDYAFQITKTDSGTAIEVWDTNGRPQHDYHTVAVEWGVATVKATLTLPEDQTPAIVTDIPLVTQEIRYHMPEAGEVLLVWGINGWAIVPEATRPAGTVVKGVLMYTPMVREGDTFVAKVQVPAGATIEYVFQITKTRSGTAMEFWDANGNPGQDYHTVAGQGSVAKVQAPPSVARDVAAVDLNIKLLWLGLVLLTGLCVVFVTVVVRVWGVRPGRPISLRNLLRRLVDRDVLMIAVVIITIAMIGCSTVSHYGLSTDEPAGFWRIWSNFDLITKGKTAPGDWKYYGPVFDITSEMVFQIQGYFRRNFLHQDQDPGSQYYFDRMKVKHPLTFLTSLIAYVSVAGIVGVLCGRKYAWFGPVVLALFPRFWGHSFFNFKDIPFATLFIFSTYVGAHLVTQYLKVDNKVRIGANRVTVTAILYGILAGLLTGIRIGGLIVIFFILIAHILVRPGKRSIYRDFAHLGAFYVLMFVAWLATTILVHPASWSNPIGWLFEAVGYQSKHPLPIEVLFDGLFVSAQALPWYYLPKWIVITVPLIFQIAFIFGLVLILAKYPGFSDMQRAGVVLVLLQIFFLPIFAIVKNSTIYDGMRQFLFVLPGIAVVSATSLVWIYRSIPIKIFKVLALIFIIIILTEICYNIIILHPYEYIYFNRTFGGLKNAHNRYETDYWGLSMREGMEWINKNGNSDATVVVGGPLHSAKIFADPSLSVVELDYDLEKMKISKSYYYLAIPKHGLQNVFPECRVVYQVVRQGVPLTIVKHCDDHTAAVQEDVTGVSAASTLRQDQTPADVADTSLVTQEIRYHMPEAGEVFLIWGINGWTVVPEETHPVGTLLKNGVMHTPMAREGDTFVAKVQVPSSATIDYGFLITKTRNGAAVEVWDAKGDQDYHTIAARDGAVEVQTTLRLAQNQTMASVPDVRLPLLIGLSIVSGIGTILIIQRNSITLNFKTPLYTRRLIYLRDLLRELVARDMKLRYKRSILGMAWSLLNPLMQMLVFVFLFRRVLPLDIPDYPSFVFIGVLAWSWFQTALSLATGAITDNRDLIRRPGFPTAVLPLVTVTTHLIHFLLALPILLLFIALGGGRLTSTILTLPLVILLQFLLILGLGYLVATIHVTFRDTQHLLGVFLMLLFYLTPVFYDASIIPARYQLFYHLNPMFHLIAAYRTILIQGSLPDLRTLLILGALVGGLLWLGHTVFTRASYRFVEEL